MEEMNCIEDCDELGVITEDSCVMDEISEREVV
jgi:hypothetical protein